MQVATRIGETSGPVVDDRPAGPQTVTIEEGRRTVGVAIRDRAVRPNVPQGRTIVVLDLAAQRVGEGGTVLVVKRCRLAGRVGPEHARRVAVATVVAQHCSILIGDRSAGSVIVEGRAVLVIETRCMQVATRIGETSGPVVDDRPACLEGRAIEEGRGTIGVAIRDQAVRPRIRKDGTVKVLDVTAQRVGEGGAILVVE